MLPDSPRLRPLPDALPHSCLSFRLSLSFPAPLFGRRSEPKSRHAPPPLPDPVTAPRGSRPAGGEPPLQRIIAPARSDVPGRTGPRNRHAPPAPQPQALRKRRSLGNGPRGPRRQRIRAPEFGAPHHRTNVNVLD
ncbi:hypothetical protein FAIPA1_40128 [Frankia sp. AiPs1]